MMLRCGCAAELQVLSAVVRHFTRGMAPVSMVCKAKTPAHAWGLTSSEVLSSLWCFWPCACEASILNVICIMSSGDRVTSLLTQEYMEFRSGDMVTGLLDKAQFGSYGLVHSVQVCVLAVAVEVSIIHMYDVIAVLQAWSNLIW
jgi:hypothetical protein